MKRPMPVGILIFIGLAMMTHYVKVNAMGSLPIGIYWMASPSFPLVAGVIVAVQTTQTVALMRTLHGSWVAPHPILKPVAAVAGETVCRQADRLRIADKDWGLIYATSPDGHRLPHWLDADECRVLLVGEVFLASHVDGSLDSRYVGPVPITAIQSSAIPLLTWRP